MSSGLSLSSLSLSPSLLSPIEELPPELAEWFIAYLTLQEKLVLRQVNRRFNALVVPRTSALVPPARPHLSTLRLHKLQPSGVLHVSSPAVDLPTAQHFIPLMDHALKTWKRWAGEEKKKVDCFATFAIPSMANFSLFATPMTIDHFEIAKLLPIYCEGSNLQQLQRLLTGCSIEKATLVFDHSTLPNLLSVPPFLHSISCRHVRFLLEKAFDYEMLHPFTQARLATSLVSSGISEVSLIAEQSPFGRPQPPFTCLTRHIERASCYLPSPLYGMATIERDCPSQAWIPFAVLSSFFRAGIKTVNVERFAIQGKENRGALDRLIHQLSHLGLPLSLRLHLMQPIELLREGRYRMRDDEKNRRVVRVKKEDGGGQCISIDIGVEAADPASS